MSTGLGGIECHLARAEDYPSTFELDLRAVVDVLSWLSRLP
jgi:hypothetical protein